MSECRKSHRQVRFPIWPSKASARTPTAFAHATARVRYEKLHSCYTTGEEYLARSVVRVNVVEYDKKNKRFSLTILPPVKEQITIITPSRPEDRPIVNHELPDRRPLIGVVSSKGVGSAD